jgi:hypothetical protein
MSDGAELRRLSLKVERGLAVQRQLRVLLAAADTTVVGHRLDLRNLRARIARRLRGPRRT